MPESKAVMQPRRNAIRASAIRRYVRPRSLWLSGAQIHPSREERNPFRSSRCTQCPVPATVRTPNPRPRSSAAKSSGTSSPSPAACTRDGTTGRSGTALDAAASQSAGRTSGRMRGLSRADIVDVAVAVADAEGTKAVSMRRIDRDLRVGELPPRPRNLWTTAER